MDPKVIPKFISPTKPLESSTMTQEEKEEIFLPNWKGGKEDGWGGKEDGWNGKEYG
jgi:hypothetical protein